MIGFCENIKLFHQSVLKLNFKINLANKNCAANKKLEMLDACLVEWKEGAWVAITNFNQINQLTCQVIFSA